MSGVIFAWNAAFASADPKPANAPGRRRSATKSFASFLPPSVATTSDATLPNSTKKCRGEPRFTV